MDVRLVICALRLDDLPWLFRAEGMVNYPGYCGSPDGRDFS